MFDTVSSILCRAILIGGSLMKYELDDEVISFKSIYEGLPKRLNELINAPSMK